MDFRRIEYFLKVADTMNISRAAEMMHISHQGLSKQIRQLEQDLGAPLLERTSSGIALTELGKRMNEWFRPLVNEVNYRYEKLEEFVRHKKTTVSLGYFNALSYRRCVASVLEQIKGKQESIQVDILAADVGQVRRMLYEDQIDLAVSMMMHESDWEEVSWKILKRVPLKVIVSEKHPWYEKDRITEEDLAQGRVLYYEEGSPTFLDDLEIGERIPARNYDSYISRLEDGTEFGVVADVYSRREGEFRLIDLPQESQTYAAVVLAWRKEHPLRELFVDISVEDLDNGKN